MTNESKIDLSTKRHLHIAGNHVLRYEHYEYTQIQVVLVKMDIKRLSTSKECL